MTSTRTKQILFSGLMLLILHTSHAQPTISPEKPNIIFILADDLGWGDLGAYGNPIVKTPNLDRLAARGTSFKQFYVSSPVCSPSRATFLTGRYPAELSLHGHISGNAESNKKRGIPNWLDPDIETVADRLKDSGYKTAHIGKWHLGPIRGRLSESAPKISDYGFDHAISRYDYGINESPGSRDLEYDPYFRARSSQLFVDSALEFIKENREQPFYVNIWSLVPHAPLNPTPEEIAAYKEANFDFDQFPATMQRYAENANDPHGQLLTYAAAVTGFDQAVGKLLDELDRMELTNNTLIFFASDNGPEDYHISNAENSGMGSSGDLRGRKRSIYEGGIRVPLIVSWPGHIPAGEINEKNVVASVDFFPTMAALAGTTASAPLPGEDVTDVFFDKDFTRKGELLWEWRFSVVGDRSYSPPQLAIREDNWKLLCNPNQTAAELYNLNTDPEEKYDISSSNPDTVEQLRTKLKNWLESLPRN